LAARPRYLRGAWGPFEALLEDAIAASVPVINAAGAVLEADERDAEADAAFAALARLLPAGTIDPQGEALDLDHPIAISLPTDRLGARSPVARIGSRRAASAASAAALWLRAVTRR
jgi:hypothetical protein